MPLGNERIRRRPPALLAGTSGGHPNGLYSTANGNSAMNPACICTTGGSQPHENMSPYLALRLSSLPYRESSPRRTKGEELLCQISS